VSGAAPAHHIVLSDGLASMSVYIEKLDPAKKKFVGASYMGAVNVYGAVVDDHQITVVGEVPAATVKMVAESIQYAK
jgi:sigma-E factor negative regulatory protein RseB